MSENNEWKSYYMQKPIKDNDDIYFKCICFYQAMTEIYDRRLTDKRSQYEETEAYVTGENRKYSEWYALKLYRLATEYIVFKTKKSFDANRWGRERNSAKYSAQGWINVFEHLKQEQDKIIVELLEIYDKQNISG